jgi:hypothetical protein
MEQISLNILETDYVRFLVKDTARIFLKFESAPLIDEISGQVVMLSGEQFPFLEKTDYGNGIRLKPKSSLSTPLLLQNTSEFSIGFWLRPHWVTPTISPLTNLPVYYRMALFDKSAFSYSSYGGFVSSSNGTFVIYEESREDGFNVMKIQLTSSDKRTVSVETERYETGKMHHFWIAYYGPSRRLEVYINGVQAKLFSEDGLAIPQSLNSNSYYFNINNSAIGYSALIRANAGLLDELVVLNSYVVDSKTLANVINLGVEYIIDKSLLYKDIVHKCFACDDPTSLGVTSVLSNGKNFYAGRNDGVVFRGDRTMWQVRRDFANKDEIKFVKKNVFDSSSEISVEDGALKLYKASVRI